MSEDPVKVNIRVRARFITLGLGRWFIGVFISFLLI